MAAAAGIVRGRQKLLVLKGFLAEGVTVSATQVKAEFFLHGIGIEMSQV